MLIFTVAKVRGSNLNISHIFLLGKLQYFMICLSDSTRKWSDVAFLTSSNAAIKSPLAVPRRVLMSAPGNFVFLQY